MARIHIMRLISVKDLVQTIKYKNIRIHVFNGNVPTYDVAFKSCNFKQFCQVKHIDFPYQIYMTENTK